MKTEQIILSKIVIQRCKAWILLVINTTLWDGMILIQPFHFVLFIHHVTSGPYSEVQASYIKTSCSGLIETAPSRKGPDWRCPNAGL